MNFSIRMRYNIDTFFYYRGVWLMSWAITQMKLGIGLLENMYLRMVINWVSCCVLHSPEYCKYTKTYMKLFLIPDQVLLPYNQEQTTCH